MHVKLKGFPFVWKQLTVFPEFQNWLKLSRMSSSGTDLNNTNTRTDIVEFNQRQSQKQIKKSIKRATRKIEEKKRLAAKRAELRIRSFTNDSDVLLDEKLVATSYYYDNGLRKVYPYKFTFSSHAKGRWFGKTIMEVSAKEFNELPEQTLRRLERGELTVNGKAVNGDYKLKANDVFENTVHRHEHPVSAAPIEIIENNDKLVVVNKPCSVPMHPCGRYRFNSLVYILAKDYGLKNLRGLYRLDRLTSGVAIFCKTQGLANVMSEHIKNRNTEKTYVCRVEGEFPEGEVECREPLQTLDNRVGLQQVALGGKQAYTTFERMSYNGRSSVVKCRPHTGRTHQIRVHLQFLGYPILNDFLYNCYAWGPQKGKNGQYGKSQEQLVKDVAMFHDGGRWKGPDSNVSPSRDSASVDSLRGSENEENHTCDPTQACNSNAGDCFTGSGDGFSSQPCEAVDSERTCKAGSVVRQELNTVQPSTSESNTITTDSGKHKLDPEDPIGQSGDGLVEKKIKLDSNVVSEAALSTMSGDILTNQSSENCLPSSQTAGKAESSSDHRLPDFDPNKMTYDSECPDCQSPSKDPPSEDLIMYLHALRNKGPGWDFSTELPAWAQEDWHE